MTLHKNFTQFFLLDVCLLLIPISIVLGNVAINVLALFIFFSLILNFFYNKNVFNNKKFFLYFLLLLIFVLLINVFLSKEKYVSYISSLGIIRYYLIFLSLIICHEYSELFRKLFYKLVLIVLIFVIADTYIQYFFKQDVFGYIVQTSHGKRLSGPFGDELVVGSYISKMFFLSVLYLIGKSKNLYLYSFSLFSLLIVILSNERSASIMLFASLILFYFLWIKSFKYKIFTILTIFTIFFALLNLNKDLKNHFIKIPIKYYNDNHHKAHFLTGFEIFKDNKLIGSGLNTFRFECSSKKYDKIKSKYSKNRCATHPHNIYIEILSETGIVGMFLFLFINFYILNFYFRKWMTRQFNDNDKVLFCFFFLLFFPFQTTGSFFSTWNGIFYWLFYGIFFCNLRSGTHNSIKT